MQKLHNDAHPVELALIAVLAVVEAITVLVVAVVALLLTVAPITATSPVAPVTQPTPPAVHPLVVVAADAAAALEGNTVAQLRRMARAAGLPRALSRTGRRDALLNALVGLELACS